MVPPTIRVKSKENVVIKIVLRDILAFMGYSLA